MYRLWHHQLETILNDTFSSLLTYLFWTIPQGMFVDIDDPDETFHPYYNQLRATHVRLWHWTTRLCQWSTCSCCWISYFFGTCREIAFAISLAIHQGTPVDWDTNGNLFSSSLQDPSMGRLERVWVAADNDDDCDSVMWTTILACWVGVLWMLQDIPYVRISMGRCMML
jgi:hypothetical protein